MGAYISLNQVLALAEKATNSSFRQIPRKKIMFRTTTYTVIKRLGERGVLKNDNGTVTSLVSKDEAQACEIDELVEKKFEGSLPAFIAAFTKHQDMSEDDLDEVQRMIDRIRKGGSQ